MKRFLLAVGTILFLAGAGPASANITFTFSGVTFDDGGTLTGTFITNDTATALIDFDITTAGGAVTGFEYTPGTAGSGSTSLPGIIVVEPASLDHILQVTFSGGLTTLGAPILIGTFDSFEQVGTTHRDITAGLVSAAPAGVPEPSTIALLGIGVLGLLFFARRSRQG